MFHMLKINNHTFALKKDKKKKNDADSLNLRLLEKCIICLESSIFVLGAIFHTQPPPPL